MFKTLTLNFIKGFADHCLNIWGLLFLVFHSFCLLIWNYLLSNSSEFFILSNIACRPTPCYELTERPGKLECINHLSYLYSLCLIWPVGSTDTDLRIGKEEIRSLSLPHPPLSTPLSVCVCVLPQNLHYNSMLIFSLSKSYGSSVTLLVYLKSLYVKLWNCVFLSYIL